METHVVMVEAVSSKVVEYSAVQEVLSDLRSRYSVIKWDVTTAKGMVDARLARSEIRKWRTGLEKERQRIKAAVLERGRLIDTEAKRITDELVALEDPIDSLIKDEEGKKERERIAKEEAEKKRVEIIQEKIERYRNFIFTLRGKTATQLKDIAMSLRIEPITEVEYQEFQQSAKTAREQAVTEIDQLHAEEVLKEEEKARIIMEREELSRLRLDQEAREKESERVRAEKDKIERAAREEEETRLRKIREAEDDRLAKERMALERERIAQELAQADREKIEKSRQERIQKEKEERERKIEREAAIFAAKEAELAKKQKEQEEQVRLMSERRKRLAAEKRDTPSKALQDILELAENVADHPDHQAVRAQIAFIAEASL